MLSPSPRLRRGKGGEGKSRTLDSLSLRLAGICFLLPERPATCIIPCILRKQGTVIEAPTQTIQVTNRENIYRRNFFYFLSDVILFTVAIIIFGPQTVIPDFIRHLTHCEILIGHTD